MMKADASGETADDSNRRTKPYRCGDKCTTAKTLVGGRGVLRTSAADCGDRLVAGRAWCAWHLASWASGNVNERSMKQTMAFHASVDRDLFQ